MLQFPGLLGEHNYPTFASPFKVVAENLFVQGNIFNALIMLCYVNKNIQLSESSTILNHVGATYSQQSVPANKRSKLL